MQDPRWFQLAQFLIDRGWVWRDDTLYAPHETMCFTTSSEQPDYARFRASMSGAAEAASDDIHEDVANVDRGALHADLVSLVAALDDVLAN